MSELGGGGLEVGGRWEARQCGSTGSLLWGAPGDRATDLQRRTIYQIDIERLQMEAVCRPQSKYLLQGMYVSVV
ncbi:hypothetical protein J6590_032660 [Homalodisca vitripennis]|nr:hypothetical protein J6590_032660 [Homalodisca vitripennis]